MSLKPSRPYVVAVVSCLILPACQMQKMLPGKAAGGDVETRAAVPAEAEADVFTIRRAESPSNTELFDTGAALNVPRHAASINDTARMLAGLPALTGNDAYPDVRATSGWSGHAARMNELWRDYEARHHQPIRRWAAREIGDLQGANALFYPFSGPDFLFADAFFPRVETVALCGLESAEPLPQLSSLTGGDIEAGLNGLRNSLNSVMQFSFFITKDMRTDLQATRFRGVLPVLLVFLARSGHGVESVDSIRLDGGGNAVLAQAGQGATGLLIRARSPHGGSRRIFYFKQDLSNESMSPGAPLLRFVSQLGRPPAFTKSASYLMHEGSFSVIRDYLMQSCRALVQDPSGVPYSQLVKSGINVRLYGDYKGTLQMFSEHNQPDLIAAYRDAQHPAQGLDFGIGYLYNPATTSLMVARGGH
ncbi:MAG: hypothetical protein K1X78_28235 [Verrucomicrobiaceae bacterium]|nr:hypothetical protein [Verrucomicrobiaceae bacterium]